MKRKLLIFYCIFANVSIMANEPFEPENRITLSSEDSIRAYVHPVRMEMLARLGRQELTLSQLAEAMGTIPANLSRHLKRLTEQDLVKLVRSRDTGRNLEKYYRARAKAFRVKRGGSPGDKASTALAILRDNLDDALSEGSPSLEGALAYIVSIRLPKRRKDELYARIGKLVKEYETVRDDEGESLVLSLAVYPGSASGFPGKKIVL